ncbi:M3 family metallopeptidase [Kingella kingae]|uniref:M3 family metallopeptidase n=2 Tax=Kingella kingae TaxID=504 RepID=UPI000409BA70|nr:M3 family metallopeptidase [Kingella kingae]MDK4585782.1 M3 family metallopeptidase [Kingella kingae]MDK4603801.1 M3 family metallopeptidase [Kingella kingae]MDK4618043.1 M3 family metallopeptidase [Kingella kingae]MDK4630094.1 M3 family metallopeptidase [Kingella kingae]MDK4647784.1 M3 family metallopeptidase [Kingella kingae]
MQRRTFLKISAFALAAAHFPAFAQSPKHSSYAIPAALQNNPLLDFSDLPHFSQVQAAHIVPAIAFLIKEYRQQIEQLSKQPAPTWDSYYLPLADYGNRLSRAWSVVSHLHSVRDTPDFRTAYSQAENQYSDFDSWAGMHQASYRAFLQLKKQPALNVAQTKAIDDALLGFKLSGVALNAAQQRRFAAINKRLAALSTRFDNQVKDSRMAWEKIISNPNELAGLPESALQAALESAKSKGKTGYRFTLDYPSYIAIQTYAKNRSLREQSYRAYMTQASAGKTNNSPVIDEILKLRQEQAALLGFKNYAELSLATKMAESPTQVLDFLNDLVQKVRPKAVQDLADLRAYAAEKGEPTELQLWDLNYLANQMKAERYSVDKELLRPYFPEQRVLAGLFDIAQRLFGIKVQAASADVWHEDVRFYRVFNQQNQHIASFYTDLYAREHKNGGAWMNGLIDRTKLSDGSLQLPVALLVCNFSQPVAGKPSLLLHDEAITLFHEFGHCLHHMLTQVDVAAVAGTNGVAWDAVEFPSQLLENWCWNADALPLIATHYETGEPLPTEWLHKILSAKNFQAGQFMLRQLEYGLLDFRLHTQTQHPANAATRVNASIQNSVAVLPEPAWARRANTFSHIFSGGYAAGYYSYMWADVLAADAFTRFEQDGVFNRNTGKAFADSVLAAGGSVAAMELFKQFQGRAPDATALLKQNGIL